MEANIGDVFLLGTHSWQVKKVEVGTVRVHDAGAAPPTIPFWLGEAQARTVELSTEVGTLRDDQERARAGRPGRAPFRPRARLARARRWPIRSSRYLAAGGRPRALPTGDRMVIERFFDESEGTQLVFHAPFGGGINRALGLALRKRFCVSFDFELQAAADDDTVSLSLGPHTASRCPQVPAMSAERPGRGALTQAVLPPPDVRTRWRWNLNRGPGRAGSAQRAAPTDPPPADGGGRPVGRRLAGPRGLPGERDARTGPGARPRAGPPDRHRLSAGGARRRWPGRGARPDRVRRRSRSGWSSRSSRRRWLTAS